MLRFINICLVLGLVALAYVIYEVKYEARALDEEIASLKKDIDAERDSVAVLRAEWSLLNRPERIERLAEKYLKLQPARPDQLASLDAFGASDFERVRAALAAGPQPAVAEARKTAAAKTAANYDSGAKGTSAFKPAATGSIKTPAKAEATPRPRQPIAASAAE